MHVIIVGAGLTGLAIALGLKKRGICYVTLERQLERDRSDGQNKETLVNIPFPGVFRRNIKKTKRLWSQYVNIKATLFERYLQEGKRVSSVEMTPDGPMVVCDDGSREHGSVVIGADGSGSHIRRWLLAELAEPEVLPSTVLNLTVQYSAEHAAALGRMLHPVIDIDPRKPETWGYYILSSWPEIFRVDGEKDLNRFQLLQARMDDWAEPFASGVGWAPKSLEIKEDVMKIWSPKPWNIYGGRITLAGDAAHSMTWHRGQGANIAFADAFQFVKAIESVVRGEAPLQAAIEAYEKDVIARGVKEVAISKAQMESSHSHSSYKNSHVARHGVDPVA